MTILTSVTEIEDRIVDTIREIQRPVVDYVRKSVEQVEGRLPKLSYPKTLPKPGEVVESQFVFAKALLDSQRSFVTELVDAMAPLVEPDEDQDEAAQPAPSAKAEPASTSKPSSKAKTTKTATSKTTKA